MTQKDIESRIALLEGNHVMLENPFTRAELLEVYRLALAHLERIQLRKAVDLRLGE